MESSVDGPASLRITQPCTDLAQAMEPRASTVGLSERSGARRLIENGPNVVARDERHRRIQLLAKDLINPLVLLSRDAGWLRMCQTPTEPHLGRVAVLPCGGAADSVIGGRIQRLPGPHQEAGVP